MSFLTYTCVHSAWFVFSRMCVNSYRILFRAKSLLLNPRSPTPDICDNHNPLKKCHSKFDCLIFQMFFYQRTETNSKQTMQFHPRKIICLDRFLITLIGFNCFRSIFKYFEIFCHLFLHVYILYRISAFVNFCLLLLLHYIYANFIFYSHLKMTSERSKRRDLLALCFITKSQSFSGWKTCSVPSWKYLCVYYTIFAMILLYVVAFISCKKWSMSF